MPPLSPLSLHSINCVSDYIKFCTENSVPTKKVRCYPNNKPWVTSDLKALLNKKKRAFTAGDPAELRSVQKELKRSLKESKDAYRKKLEERLERNQTRDVWSGMRTITGFQKKGIRSADGNVDQANELNQFFNRFDSSYPPAVSIFLWITMGPLHTSQSP
ncbi:hypothetical protein D4764_0170340 [Takifugu flavidus]|uniref:Uncharacterized protein n=1 Tax=Takifugu flavidus TaxID=433684 RepID=A0A5C6MH81_9TELE|nr:hypothetical protein D4764_0170340 [Takifugu flavidus]